MHVKLTIPAPDYRQYHSRMSDDLRNLKPGEGVQVDGPTAACLRNFGRMRGWKTAQRKAGNGNFNVWRIS